MIKGAQSQTAKDDFNKGEKYPKSITAQKKQVLEMSMNHMILY